MDTKRKIISWFFQILAAAILIPIGIYKFQNGQADIFIFTQLEMEPLGRYLIGVLEILAGLLLLSRNFCAGGAVLGIGVMCGAFLAHISVLGFVIQGDNGKHILFLGGVSLSCLVVICLRKRELPIIGDLF